MTLSDKERAVLTIASRRGASIIKRLVGGRYYAVVPIAGAPVKRLLRDGMLTYAADEPDHLVVSNAGRVALARDGAE